MSRLAVAALAAALLGGASVRCDGPTLPADIPPGSCGPGDRVCYFEARSGRELALRCNEGEVVGAIWIVDEVCDDGAGCVDGACQGGTQ